MGLTLHYRLTAPDGFSARRAAALVRRLHVTASKWAVTGRIANVLPVSSDRTDLDRFGCAWRTLPHPDHADTSVGVQIPPDAGWIFPVKVGEDCELLWLGLCRYPPTVPVGRCERSTRLGARWRFAGFCKTQYASLQGWEHFARCHVAALDLLGVCRGLGLRVKIDDEGGYWPRRNLATLRQRLDQMNGIVAGLAGALKDAAEEPGGKPVRSPIFAHPQFERLEANGVGRHGPQIAAVTAALAR